MTRICTQEEIKEMVNNIQIMAKNANIQRTDNAFKYIELIPLYQLGWSQKDLKEIGAKLFHQSYDGKTFRKYIKTCNVETQSAAQFFKRRNLMMDTGCEIIKFTDMQRCVSFIQNKYPEISEETIRKNIEKVLSKSSPQSSYKGYRFSQLKTEDTRPDLEDTLLKIHEVIMA